MCCMTSCSTTLMPASHPCHHRSRSRRPAIAARAAAPVTAATATAQVGSTALHSTSLLHQPPALPCCSCSATPQAICPLSSCSRSLADKRQRHEFGSASQYSGNRGNLPCCFRRHDGRPRALLQPGAGLQAVPHLQWHRAFCRRPDPVPFLIQQQMLTMAWHIEAFVVCRRHAVHKLT